MDNLNSVLITYKIDAHKKWDVEVVNIPGTDLIDKNHELVHMVLHGKLSNLVGLTAHEVDWEYILY